MKLDERDLAQAYRDMRAAKRTRLAQEARRDAGETVDPAALLNSARALRMAHERIAQLIAKGAVHEEANPMIAPHALNPHEAINAELFDIVSYDRDGVPLSAFRVQRGVASLSIVEPGGYWFEPTVKVINASGPGSFLTPPELAQRFTHRDGRTAPSDSTLMGALARADAGSSAPELLAKAEAALGAVLDFLNAPLGTSVEQRNALAEKAASAVRGYDQAYGLKR